MKTKYILITPVYNEEELIERVIESVIIQTILPQKWIIADDGSTDTTAEIIKRYVMKHDFITYLQLERANVISYYNRRVHVVLAGIDEAKKYDYDFLAVIDADITLQPTYYEGIMREFDRYPMLGIAAGVFAYKTEKGIEQVLMDRSCTPGSNHVFRRECYEQIGGYVPLKFGGDDSFCDIRARMHGWKTWSFDEYQAVQHRIVGTAEGHSVLKARFRQGLTDYGLSAHPVFMLAKLLRRAFLEKPYLTGSLARMAGFLYGYWQREERKIPPEAIRFVRREQIRRLLSYLTKCQSS